MQAAMQGGYVYDEEDIAAMMAACDCDCDCFYVALAVVVGPFSVGAVRAVRSAFHRFA
jgi:hypothetical protein